jgi:transcriptional regulator with GAF, ATPase, and Fis domain
MSSTIRRRKQDISLVSSSDRVRSEAAATQDKIRLLRQLMTELQRELESLNQVPTPAVEQGLDFYYEVSRFESEMIRRALVFVGGHQGNAAQLLNLKETTLGAKIKRYCIQPGALRDVGQKE